MKIKKSTGVALAFLIYVSVTAAYLLPRNTEIGQTEKVVTCSRFVCNCATSLAGAQKKRTIA